MVSAADLAPADDELEEPSSCSSSAFIESQMGRVRGNIGSTSGGLNAYYPCVVFDVSRLLNGIYCVVSFFKCPCMVGFV